MTRYTLLTILVLSILSCTRQQSNPTTYTPSPTIASFSPEAANIGAEITIRGENFSWDHSGNKVKFGNIDAPVIGSTTDWVKVNVPVGATTGRISVIVNGKTATSGYDFVLATGTWSQKVSFPAGSRQDPDGFLIDGKIYVLGGLSSSGYKKDLWEYNPATSAWTPKAAFPGEARYYGLAMTIGNKGYFGLGSQSITTLQNDFWEYDPAIDQWTRKADYPSSSVVNSIGFGFNAVGFVGLGSTGTPTSASTELWMFTPATNSWVRKADFPGSNGRGTSACTDQSRGYVLFGTSEQCWQYDPATNQWSQFTRFDGTFRESAIAFVLNGKIYAGLGEAWYALADFWEYDPQQNTWTRKADFVAGTGVGLGFISGNGKAVILTSEYDWETVDAGQIWEFTP